MARELRDVGVVRVRRRPTGDQWRLEFRRDADGKKLRVYAWPAGPGGRPRPFRDEQDAQEALVLIRGEVAKRKPLATVLEPWFARVRPENLLLARAERWLDHVRSLVSTGERSPNYLADLERQVRGRGYWASWWAERELQGITYGELEDWSRWLAREGGASGKGVGPKTRALTLGAFHSFLAWLRRRGELDTIPDFPTIERDEYVPTIIDIDTQGRVLAAIPRERRGAFLACRLGVRPGEVRAMDLAAYRVDATGQGWLTVSHAMKGANAGAPRLGTKERLAHVIPVDEELAAWISWRLEIRAKAMADGRPAWALTQTLFPNPSAHTHESRWIATALRREWHRARKRAGVDVAVKLYEGTKHSFATDAVARGVPREVVQKYLGHADPRSTDRYARLANTALLSVLRRRRTRATRSP